MKLKHISLSLVLAGLLIGCGSSSSDDTETTNTGTFVDAPVAGISYETTSGLSGVTDTKGNFKYNDNDYVTFKLGNINLGTTKASKTITPLNITSNDSKKAAYIAYILQNLDTDGNNTNDVIELPNNEKLKSLLSSINLDDENNITTTISALKSKLNDYNFTNVTINEANTTMMSYLKKQGVMTTEIGFTKEGLEGKTFYVVHTYKGDDELEKYGYVVDMTFGFDNDKMNYHLDSTYVGDKREGSLDYSIDENGVLNIDGETYQITNIFGDVIETYHTSAEDPESNETRYFTTSKEEAEKLAILLNVKTTNSYKPLIDSGKSIYLDSRSGFVTKYEANAVFNSTGAKVTSFDDEGNTKTENMTLNFNDDYTSYKGEDEGSCHIDEVNIELGYIEEQCDENSDYLFLSETEAKNFVPLFINHFNGEKIDPKSLDNKVLYKISDYEGDNNYYNVWLQAMKINGDKIDFYDTKNWVLDTNAELVEAWKENNVKVSYPSNGKIDIEGTYSWDGENEDDTGTYDYVYKFNLAGQKPGETFPLIFLANEDYSLKETLENKLEGFTFTKGYAYCTLLFDECYFDKDAMDEIINHYNQ